ncbi:hypothetical protein F4778DRAFT_220634 [Xylariomycetidae sp. FL2044]|nr:hypothetical protein F4778DRAFT_220634 [Xylariomycetidae sp. FL2044]
MAHHDPESPPRRHRPHRNRHPSPSRVEERSAEDYSHRHRHRHSHSHKRHSKRLRPAEGRDLAKGNLSRLPAPPTGHGIVESWLEQTRGGLQHGSSMSLNPRGELRKSSPSLRGAGYLSHAYHESAHHAWRPRYIPSEERPRSPSHLLGGEVGSSLKRPRLPTSDSSLISRFENGPKPPDPDDISEPLEYEHVSSPGPPIERAPGHRYTPSPKSRLPDLVVYEKQPRRKTREDKYDTKKGRGHSVERTFSENGQRGKISKKSKKSDEKKRKKVLKSSKNVMNNFTSDTVLNDRITVTPSLKPGLFENGRKSKTQPISDLTFSDLRFLKDPRPMQQRKPLSKSRVKERERERREMEQVSSFFLPPKTDGKFKPPPLRPGREETKSTSERLPEYGYMSRHRAETSPSLSSRYSHINQGFPQSLGYHEDMNPTTKPQRSDATDCKSGASRATTYFTWSSSHQSPQARRSAKVADSCFSDSARTVTPESIREAMIATGIYRGTDIFPYDAVRNVQTTKPPNYVKQASSKKQLPDTDSNQESSPGEKSRVLYQDQAVMTENTMLNGAQYFSTNHPYETMPQQSNTRAVKDVPQGHTYDPISSEPASPIIDRKQIAQEAHLPHSLKRTSGFNHISQEAGIGSTLVPTQSNVGPSPTGLTGDRNSQMPESGDRDSIASRDMMPPPPLPAPRTTTAEHSKYIQDPKSDLTCTLAPKATPCPLASGQAMAGTNTTPAPSLGPGRTTERAISSLDLASWLPQSRTPSIVGSGRTSTFSIHLQSPIYVAQPEGRYQDSDAAGAQPSGSCENESMADFIARIEDEVERETSEMDYFSDQKPTERSQRMLNSSDSGGQPEYELVPSRPAVHEETLQVPRRFQNQQYNPEDSSLDTRSLEGMLPRAFVGYHGAGGDITDSHITAAEEFQDERLEMSKFWRPNRFSQL